jgi:propionyl-CoA synthetase
MCSNFLNLHYFPPYPGSCVKPVPGFDIQILDDENKNVEEHNKLGRISIKMPMAPSFMLTLWNNEEAFI